MEVAEDQLDRSEGPEEESEIVTEGTAFAHGDLLQDSIGPPKVDSEVEVLHEKVTKQIIKEGHGEKPSKLSTCFCYGKEGSFSFPNVPPMADLLYEVELIGFDEAREGKARSDMTVEERIEAADRRKMEGNGYFKDGKLEEAMQQYEMAIAYMGDDFMFQLFGKYRDMALAVKNPCHLNMAACLIKLNRYEEAIGQCSIVLAEDENNVKALFRRGKARAELSQTDAAREDFQKARKFAPEDTAIVRELRLLAEHDKAIYQKQKEIYKGIFGPRPEPKPKATNWLVNFWQWLITIFCRLFKFAKRKSD
ncbi:Peptidyl-prolyl cis-trans isomerase FKBP42 [Acorus calamus]|uniref:Peptidyl-prolyl cis-trans isomerase FKBP42 n=1 Tax=Acorus calamus TaxID=4465 RepID=A0AAV9EKD9_ACOCL|nr:Peptidyl-prolyl cis-trans isomerase FKBP42 [Acorus calamus]